MSQSRFLETSAISEFNSLVAGDFLPFVGDIVSKYCGPPEFLCYWSGKASQDSAIEPWRIRAKGSASASQEMGVWCGGCAKGKSVCDVTFSLSAPVQCALSGQVSAFAFIGGASTISTVTLIGPGGTILTATAVANAGQMVPLAFQGRLAAGVYTFSASATAPSASFAPFGESAAYDVSLIVSTCLGDVNLDGAVTGADIGQLLADWGSIDSPADLDENGVVDGADLGLLLGAWGACST